MDYNKYIHANLSYKNSEKGRVTESKATLEELIELLKEENNITIEIM